MKNINIAGRVGQDAELVMAGNSQVLKFSVAADRYKKKGEKQTPLWFRCQLWGERGEKLQEFLKGGTPVCVSGDLDLREWQTRDGANKSDLEINVNQVTLMGSGQTQNQSRGQEIRDEDIPF